MAEEKTNVMRMLEQAGVAYTPSTGSLPWA